MKQIIPIPLHVLNVVNDHVDLEYPTISQKQRSKLKIKLIEYWLFIKITHDRSIAILEQDKPMLAITETSHLNYVNISLADVGSKFRTSVGSTILIYKDLQNILVNCDLIQKNSKYKVDGFTQSYRPHPNIRYADHSWIEVDINKILTNFISIDKLVTKNHITYEKLIRDLSLIRFDLIGYYNYLMANIGNKVSKNSESILTPVKAYAHLIKAIKINAKIHFFDVASTGRIYSSGANIATHAIPFMTLNGERVVEVDASNSQPLLLASLVDHPQFKADVEAGVFYDRLAEAEGVTRDKIKKASFKYLFFNDKPIGPTWITRLDKCYPGLAEQVNRVKGDSQLWFLLQKAEADIWIKVAKRMPFPVVTRHDSILVNAKHASQVAKAITKEYKRQRNLTVTLKQTQY